MIGATSLRAPLGWRRWGIVLVAAVAIASSLLLTRSVDFRVYSIGAQAPFEPGNDAYGPRSGAGFPMEYRYPPVTYLVFEPLTSLPLSWAGVLWMLGAWAAAILTAIKAIGAMRLRFTPLGIVAASACTRPYVVLAVRSGNVQPYIVAAIFASMLFAETRPVGAAAQYPPLLRTLLVLGIDFYVSLLLLAALSLRLMLPNVSGPG